MNNQPLISIIVPCYNVEQYLPKCIDSILNQTYKNLEVWLVDDGSPDNCGEICDEYAKRDVRIHVIHKENGGLADARNVALDVMTGEYVVCVDSDDYISPTHIEGLYHLIEKYGADVSVNTFCSFYEGASPNPSPKSAKDWVLDGLHATEMMFSQENFDNAACGKMYKASLFDGIRYPKGLLFEDLPTTYRLLLKANKVVYSNYKSYFYLLRENSIEGSAFSYNKYKSCISILNQLENDRCLFTNKVQIALNARLLSFLFHVLIIVPNSYADIQHKLLELISNYRLSVLFNNKARMKNRIAALLSFGGMPAINLFKRIGSYRK